MEKEFYMLKIVCHNYTCVHKPYALLSKRKIENVVHKGHAIQSTISWYYFIVNRWRECMWPIDHFKDILCYAFWYEIAHKMWYLSQDIQLALSKWFYIALSVCLSITQYIIKCTSALNSRLLLFFSSVDY